MLGNALKKLLLKKRLPFPGSDLWPWKWQLCSTITFETLHSCRLYKITGKTRSNPPCLKKVVKAYLVLSEHSCIAAQHTWIPLEKSQACCCVELQVLWCLRPSLQRPDVKCPVAYQTKLGVWWVCSNQWEEHESDETQSNVSPLIQVHPKHPIICWRQSGVIFNSYCSKYALLQEFGHIMVETPLTALGAFASFHSNNGGITGSTVHFGPHGCQYWPDWRDPDRLEVPHPESQLFQTPKLWTKMTPLMKNLETKIQSLEIILTSHPKTFPCSHPCLQLANTQSIWLILVHPPAIFLISYIIWVVQFPKQLRDVVFRCFFLPWACSKVFSAQAVSLRISPYSNDDFRKLLHWSPITLRFSTSCEFNCLRTMGCTGRFNMWMNWEVQGCKFL